jgi:transcriptional regulator with XRE-family HTH domain
VVIYNWRQKNMMIGKRIKELREQLGLTQEELAEKVGVTRSALANYESGLREPKGDILVRFARALDTTTDYLLGKVGRTNNPKPPNNNHSDLSTSSWWFQDTPPTDVELEEFLKNANVYFDGAPLNEEDKEDIITYLKVKWEREKRKREKERKTSSDEKQQKTKGARE